MSDEGGEKTEEPTQKKLDDSKKRGQVWKSRDFTGVMVFLVGLGTLKATWPSVEGEFRKLFAFSFEHLAHPKDIEVATFQLMVMGVWSMLLVTIPIIGAAAIVGALTEFVQVGSLFTLDPLMPKLEKLNPFEGMKNLVSKKQLVELMKNLLKIGITAYVVYGVVQGALPMVVQTIFIDIAGLLTVLGELVFRVAVRVGLLYMLFSIFDLWFQRRSYMKDMMMSKDEVKREYKESEGDPHHKHKRKELHMEILEGAQMEAVKGADVVVTNPTHLAVAIRYDKEKDQAPMVIAKGMNLRAEAIKELAKQSNVAILRNVPLAHALNRLEVGHEIPEELYDAVAEVLNFVYGLRKAS
jgi:flagellar biosynthesis protein FlhB